MKYWPGTKIIKSHWNAFSWQGKGSQLAQDYRSIRATKPKTQEEVNNPCRSFTVYSKAQQQK